jgi:glutamate synthase domain-containing protein 3
MNAGRVIVHGDAGDVLGYGMRGGRVFIKGDVGYRVGIHMKAYEGHVPVMVCGGKSRDFFGEYMAGGMLVLLGMDTRIDGPLVGGYVGTGMHGGVIYLRGEVEPWQCGKEVGIFTADEDDLKTLRPCSRSTARRSGWTRRGALGPVHQARAGQPPSVREALHVRVARSLALG